MNWQSWRTRFLLAVGVSMVLDTALLLPPMARTGFARDLDGFLFGPIFSVLSIIGLTPGPHTDEQITGLFLAVPLTLAYEAFLVWIMLSLPVWWRRRA